MEVTFIVLALAVLAIGLVVWNIKRKPPGAPHAGPDEGDIGWNDPVTPRPADDAPPHDPEAPRS